MSFSERFHYRRKKKKLLRMKMGMNFFFQCGREKIPFSTLIAALSVCVVRRRRDWGAKEQKMKEWKKKHISVIIFLLDFFIFFSLPPSQQPEYMCCCLISARAGKFFFYISVWWTTEMVCNLRLLAGEDRRQTMNHRIARAKSQLCWGTWHNARERKSERVRESAEKSCGLI